MAIRTFIAVEMSEAVRTKLATLIGRLRHAGADAKWVAAQNIHLTLKFLGDVDEAKMADVERIVAASVAGIAPFEFEVRGTGGFPDLRRPRVIFAEGHDASGALAELHRRLDKAFVDLGVEAEGREFRPHLTLARVRSPRNLKALVEALAKFADEAFGTQAVSEVAVMRSDLKPEGPTYTKLAAVKLPG